MDILMDTVVLTLDSSRLKRIKNYVPAYWRYWQFVGLARRWDRDTAEVQVFGRPMPGFETPVLIRRAYTSRPSHETRVPNLR